MLHHLWLLIALHPLLPSARPLGAIHHVTVIVWRLSGVADVDGGLPGNHSLFPLPTEPHWITSSWWPFPPGRSEPSRWSNAPAIGSDMGQQDARGSVLQGLPESLCLFQKGHEARVFLYFCGQWRCEEVRLELRPAIGMGMEGDVELLS